MPAKRRFQAKLFALWREGKIPGKKTLELSDIEKQVEIIRNTITKLPVNQISVIEPYTPWLADLYLRFTQENHTWLKKIVGAPQSKLLAFLYFSFNYLLDTPKSQVQNGEIKFNGILEAPRFHVTDKKALYFIQEYSKHSKPLPWIG